ncbi:MAG: methylenetetrahydrofolate reductase [Aestuariivita sp.]|nr:methylenetetrahydrofolate reductase [Aestuariivita sp.]
MALLKFQRHEVVDNYIDATLQGFLNDYSIEVMPRTAHKIDDFRVLLPQGTRVYIAHIEGTDIRDMVATAQRLSKDGFNVMPHFPARLIKNQSELQNWIDLYQMEAGVTQALLLAGSNKKPFGIFDNSIQLLETGMFDKAGFTHLHIAGHPEGNRDIDSGGGSVGIDAALERKQSFSNNSDAKMAIVTQFAFEAEPIIKWANHLVNIGITLPIHIGIAGPARLQTLIKFAIACGVGSSLGVLQKRSRDLSKLLLPFEPYDILKKLADYKVSNPDFKIERVHFFPLGGIEQCALWVARNKGEAPRRAELG